MKRMPLIKVASKIPGNQDIIIKDYLTGAINEHANANEICNRLDYRQETRNAEVYRISLENNSIIIEIL